MRHESLRSSVCVWRETNLCVVVTSDTRVWGQDLCVVVTWDTRVWGQVCESEEWLTFVLWWGETQESEVKCVCLKSDRPLCCGEARHKSLRSSVCVWRVTNLCVLENSDTRVWDWTHLILCTRRRSSVLLLSEWRQWTRHAWILMWSSDRAHRSPSPSYTGNRSLCCLRAWPAPSGCLRQYCVPTVTQVQAPFPVERLQNTEPFCTGVSAGVEWLYDGLMFSVVESVSSRLLTSVSVGWWFHQPSSDG